MKFSDQPSTSFSVSESDIYSNIARRRTNEGPYGCFLCKEIFELKASFLKHQREGCAVHMSSSKKRIKIDKGKIRFRKVGRINQVSMKKNSVTCGMIPIIKPNSSIEMSASFENKYKCDNCERIYENKKSYRRHRNECGVEPQFACDLCELRFKRKEHVTRHRTTHF